ncbi:hypothetical protein CHS0354_015239 [Potamilus streckersoni]|uniref:Uncharacterized protein n=1 Tax=Potamilus streckersoni TaxID=2493646 RepID=A0AAE0VIQ2_9BIVA|nr:hypothetical protein CHS0354_015239 [Potamilus streckersoni]
MWMTEWRSFLAPYNICINLHSIWHLGHLRHSSGTSTELGLRDGNVSVGLSRHIETVMTLSNKIANWRCYDEQLRQLVSRHETEWGIAHLELYLQTVLDSQEIAQSQNLISPRPEVVDAKIQNELAHGKFVDPSLWPD